MSCLAPGAELCFDKAGTSNEELRLSSRTLHDGLRRADLTVPDIQSGGCQQKIELTTPISAGPVS
jgi:hypothetical protein